MASVEKISVSLAVEDVAWARMRAKRQDKSLSAVLSDVLQQQRQTEARCALLAELGHDDISQSEIDALRKEMSKPTSARKPKTVKKARR